VPRPKRPRTSGPSRSISRRACARCGSDGHAAVAVF
jgi:hypothetical protein